MNHVPENMWSLKRYWKGDFINFFNGLNPFLLCCLGVHCQYLLIWRASEIWTPSGLSLLVSLEREDIACLLICINVLGLKWSLVLICLNYSFKYLLASFHFPLENKTLYLFHQLLLRVTDFWLHWRFLIDTLHRFLWQSNFSGV